MIFNTGYESNIDKPSMEDEASDLELQIEIEVFPIDQKPDALDQLIDERWNEKYIQEYMDQQKIKEQEELQQLLRDRIP